MTGGNGRRNFANVDTCVTKGDRKDSVLGHINSLDMDKKDITNSQSR